MGVSGGGDSGDYFGEKTQVCNSCTAIRHPITLGSVARGMFGKESSAKLIHEKPAWFRECRGSVYCDSHVQRGICVVARGGFGLLTCSALVDRTCTVMCLGFPLLATP